MFGIVSAIGCASSEGSDAGRRDGASPLDAGRGDVAPGPDGGGSDGPLASDALRADGAALDGAAGDGAPLDGAAGDGAALDGAPSDAGGCPPGQTLCGASCVVTTVDRANCGACGVACPAGAACVSSGCTTMCPSPLTLCSDRCVDVQSANTDCGACGMPCPAGMGCSAGRCVSSVPLGPGPARCTAGGGPPIVVSTPTGDVCTGSLAMVSFTHALCTCGDIGVPGLSAPALFDAYDSTRGPYMPGGRGGSVGADGTFTRASAPITISGDLRVAGDVGLTVGSGMMTVNQNLQVGYALDANGNLAVDRAGYLGGPFAPRPARFGSTIYTPACAAVPASYTRTACVDRPVTVPPPCACAPRDLVPVSHIVQHYAVAANNDNASLRLNPAVLNPPAGTVRLDLPCGYYYLDAINASNPVTIAVHGNTALFIGGAITISASLIFALDPGVTFDVFVGGTLTDSGRLTVGSPAYPSATRFYVGGPCLHAGSSCGGAGECCSGTCAAGACVGESARAIPNAVTLSVPSDLNGLFYAPNGLVSVSAPLTMYGAIFAGSYQASQRTNIHYDLAATRAGDTCPPPPPPPGDGGVGRDAGTPPADAGTPPADAGTPPADAGTPGCSSCRDCGNQACIAGACGDCTSDSQCCSPLYCVSGRCIPAPG